MLAPERIENHMADTPISFITGATGFVGAAVRARADREGASVAGAGAAGIDRRNIAGLDVEIIEGDLGRRQPYARR